MKNIRYSLPILCAIFAAAGIAGCSEKVPEPSASTQNTPLIQKNTAAAQSNPTVAPVLNDPKTSKASADYIKSHMPSAGGAR